MTDDLEPDDPKLKSVNNATRVTVAFPFSTIKMQESDEKMRELAAVVRDLAKQVAELRPGADADELVRRARALVVKFGS